MALFKVIFEIEVDAKTPLEAAKTVEDWLHQPEDHWQYYVQDNKENVFSVDLDEDDSCAAKQTDNYIPIIR